MKIGFVVLHYQNMDVTSECIDYLVNLDDDSFDIVIVDNASPNDSGKNLLHKYEDWDNVHVILNQKNLGFAQGNNLGFNYCKKILKDDIIVVMNSDVYIRDNKFIYKLKEFANQNKSVSILAPDIVVNNGFHQNPYMLNSINDVTQKKIIIKKQIGILLYSIPYVGNRLLNRKKVINFQPNKEKKVTEKIINLIPHGACIIYLPKWVYNEEIAFIEGTFLFVEEELLFDYCQYKNHEIIYNSTLEVFHMEDASQNAVNSTFLQKKISQMKYEIDSRKILLKKRKEYKTMR